jgi:aspartate/methionine/tyrosine aminotransferase
MCVLQLMQEGMTELRAVMAKHGDKFAFYEPLAGTMAFPKMRKALAAVGGGPAAAGAGGATAYCEALVEAEGIMLVPASAFDYGDERFRIGLARQNAVQVMKLWDATLTSASA